MYIQWKESTWELNPIRKIYDISIQKEKHLRTPYNKKVYEKYVHPMNRKYENLENCKNISKE